jgi:HEAT repeat protein
MGVLSVPYGAASRRPLEWQAGGFMSEIRKLVRVFLASPGDLSTEREAAREEVDEFNRLWADHFGHQIHLVRWEDVVSASGRPQALINEGLDRCELFVGMLSERWGMPPDHGGPYTSGFEEEFRTSVARREQTGKPEIKMLFKAVEPSRLADPGQELTKVLGFKDELVRNRTVLFEQFDDLSAFRKKFTACITRHVQNLVAADVEQAQDDQGGDREASKPNVSSQPDSAAEDNPLSTEGVSFLRGLLEVPESGELSAAEVARLRLIGKMVGSPQNDEEWLDAHDANLIYTSKSQLDLSRREVEALVDAGLARYSGENVPLWHWLKISSGFEDHRLAYRAFSSNAHQLVGALNALRLLGQSLPDDGPINRAAFLRTWFREKATTAEKNAAIGYLAEWGLPADLDALRAELAKDDYATRSAAAQAIVKIISRDSRESAVAALFEMQPDQIDEVLLEELFAAADSFDLDLLKKGIAQRNAVIRRRAFRALVDRDELNLETAQSLFSDKDEEIRVEAIRRARALGCVISNSQVEDILRPKAPKSAFGNALTIPLPKRYGDILRKEALSLAELRASEAGRKISFLDPVAYIAAIERDFARMKPEIVGDLRDRYKSKFATYMAEVEGDLSSSDTVEKIRGLEDFLRSKIIKDAFILLCQRGGREALPIVRDYLGDGSSDYCDEPLEFLRRYGEFSDLPLIIKWSNKRPRGLGLLGHADNRAKSLAAAAIYELGRTRLAEVLTHDLGADLCVRVIEIAGERQYRALPDPILESLMRHDDPQVRKAACLKAVRCFPKTRLAELLGRHETGAENFYYNVRFWMDLGISAPSDLAKNASLRELRALVK